MKNGNPRRNSRPRFPLFVSPHYYIYRPSVVAVFFCVYRFTDRVTLVKTEPRDMPLLHQRQGRNVIFISAYSLWLSIVKDVFKPMDGIHFFRGKDRENKITIMVRQNETSRFEPWIAGLVLINAYCVLPRPYFYMMSKQV